MTRTLSLLGILILLAATAAKVLSQGVFVSTLGDDNNAGTKVQPWRHIQYACDSAKAGDTVYVMGGIYNEKLAVHATGNSTDGYITFTPYQTDTVIIDGTGLVGDQLVLLKNINYVRFQGFELRNNLDQTFGTGIWVQGYGDHIVLNNNVIHDMRAAVGGGDAMGISVYGSDPNFPISNIAIDGNKIFNCEPGHSESLTLNGNVDTFYIYNNSVHDVNNIGIDMIGGEKTSSNPANDMARNGICRGNVVYHARSAYGGGYAAGIYVDGGQNILVERNIVYECDLGLEIGCENHGRIASGMIVRENLIFNNDKRGISFGGYNYPTTGKVTSSVFLNNTVYNNDVLHTDEGELYIEYAQNCAVKNNIFYSSSQNKIMTTAFGANAGNILDYNLYYSPVGRGNVTIDWNGTVYAGFDTYVNGALQDSHSLFGDPLFISATLPSPDLHSRAGSPGIDMGDPAFVPAPGETDFDSLSRVVGARVDAGAYEYRVVHTVPPPPQLISVDGISTTRTFLWHSSSTATGYHIEIAGDVGFNSIIYNDTAVTDTFIQIMNLPDSQICYWKVCGRNAFGESDWSTVWSFRTTSGPFNFTVANKWNLVSVPALVSNPLVSVVFPTAISPLFAYDVGYTQKESVTVGRGYWIKFNGSQVVSLSGSGIISDTINVTQGWNLIGSISAPLASFNIVPLGVHLQSFFYGYLSGYFKADTLFPGQGYWVKTDNAGKLELKSSAEKNIH
ncbi:MAG: choice-of-anchor Q domain-containing protein [Bacteroidota bacterium]